MIFPFQYKMKRVKSFISYVIPISKKIKSQHNGTLEINWINGRKVLDSANANYSYGNLQKALEFGLEKFNLKKVNSILVLGMGGGSVIHSLRSKFKSEANITAIELDSEIVKIAKEEFELGTFPNIEIVEANAMDFVKSSNQNFDLTIVDLFIDDRVPEDFYGLSFWKEVLRITPKGQVLFNSGMTHEQTFHLQPLFKLLSQHQIQKLRFQQNTLILISNY